MMIANTASDLLKSVTAAVKDALITRARKYSASPAPKSKHKVEQGTGRAVEGLVECDK